MGIPLDPNRRFLTHPSDEILEDYALCRLPEALAAPIEEHLLICPSCQNAIAETDQFVAALRSARSQPAAGWSVLPSLANKPALGPLAILIILAIVMVWKRPQETSTPVAVRLASLRGANRLSAAPAGKPLRLSIDLPDLVPTGEYRVEVVDAAGSPVWTGAVSDIGGKLIATMSKPIGNGVYWVRLYGKNAELLREFGLSAQ